MNKKRLFAIVLFIVLGLFMFTFANPRNNKNDKKPNGDIITPSKQEAVKEPEIIVTEEEKTTPIVNNNQNNNNQNNNKQTTAVPTIDLTKNKQKAIDELENYKKDYEFTNDEEHQKIIDEYTDKINNSDSKNEIDKNLENGKEAIDKLIEEDLKAYKEKAKEEVEQHAKELDFINDITPVITAINEQIDDETTKEAIDKDVKDAKDFLDDLLRKAKEEAIKQLENYKKDYPFNEKNKEIRKEIIVEGTKNINNALTIKEVLEKLKEAINKIDELIRGDLNEYKETAKTEIDKHNEDVLYSPKNKEKITEIKEKAKEEIKNTNLTDENIKDIKDIIDRIVKDTIDKINNIQKLEDTYFTVKFVDKNNKVIDTQSIQYNHDAVAPTNVADVEYKGVTYSFDKWVGDYTSVKEDLTITADYNITKATVKIYVLKDGIEIPANGKGLAGSNYNYMMDATLVLTDSIKAAAFGDKNQTIISLDDSEIRSLINKELPLYAENKEEYIYKFYVLKLAEDAFHADVAVVKDPLYDLRKELKDLLDDDYTKYQDTKTTETYNNLIDTVKENEKYRDSRNEEELKGAIADIKDAINGLVDITLERIELDNVPSGKYFVGDLDDTSKITVKAIYNDSNRNRVLGEDEYEKDVNFDSSTSGTKTITYSYEGKPAYYTYTVTDIVLIDIKLSKTNGTYYVGQNINDVTVYGIYNDTRKNRNLTTDEYTITDFDNSKPNTDVAVFAVNGTEVSKPFSYTIKYSDDQLSRIVNGMDIYVTDDSGFVDWFDWEEEYNITFYHMPEYITIESVSRVDSNGTHHTVKLNDTYYYNQFHISNDDFWILRNTNTLFAGQNIEITYLIGEQEITAEYTECLGHLKRVK